MTENITPIEEAKSVAAAESKEGTFSFMDRLLGRNYPTDDVEVYLDEAAGYKIAELEKQHNKTVDADQIKILEEQIKFQRTKAEASRYIFTLQGISNEDYDALVDEVDELYPQEYSETRNPITFAVERTEIPNEKRDVWFRSHLWGKFITEVRDSNGNVDSNITPEWVEMFFRKAPMAAIGRIGIGVAKLRMTTDWMDTLQSEDFLAKS